MENPKIHMKFSVYIFLCFYTNKRPNFGGGVLCDRNDHISVKVKITNIDSASRELSDCTACASDLGVKNALSHAVFNSHSGTHAINMSHWHNVQSLQFPNHHNNKLAQSLSAIE